MACDEWNIPEGRQSASILHSNGDGLDIAVKDGRIVGVRGREVDRVNHGRVDPKDLYGWQANNSVDRLTRPLIRRNGELVETDWDTAMDAVAGRCTELLEEQGPSAVPAVSAGANLVPGAVMALAGVRFLVAGGYHLTADADRKAAAGGIGCAQTSTGLPIVTVRSTGRPK